MVLSCLFNWCSLSSCVSPRMPLWICTTDRGTHSSVAPGLPSRRSSVWLRSGRPASRLEPTLRRSERVLIPPSSISFLTPVHLFFFPFKDASDPPETTSRLFSIWLASKPPLRNSLFLAPPCQNRHISKQLKEPDAGPRQSRGSLGRRDVITQSRVQLREKEESMACVVILFCSACFCTRYSMNVGC